MWMTIADMHNKYRHFLNKSQIWKLREYFKKMSLVAIFKNQTMFLLYCANESATVLMINV